MAKKPPVVKFRNIELGETIQIGKVIYRFTAMKNVNTLPKLVFEFVELKENK